MATICMQCALEGFVKNRGVIDPAHRNFVQSFGVVDDDTPEAHLARVHPNGVDPVERAKLEEEAGEIISQMVRAQRREEREAAAKVTTSGGHLFNEAGLCELCGKTRQEIDDASQG